MLTHILTERDGGDVVRLYLHPTLGRVSAGVLEGEHNIVRVFFERWQEGLLTKMVQSIGTPEWKAEMAAIRARAAARATVQPGNQAKEV